MIDIRNFQVRSYDLDHLDLFWEVADSREDPSAVRLEILKSVDGPGGPFTRIGTVLHNTYIFRDPDVHVLYRWRRYFYKLKVVDLESGRYVEYGPEYLRAAPDRMALEMQRREQLLFREFAGRKALLYPIITSGSRCGSCWDVNERGNTIGRPIQQSCGSCFGTTFVGGYATPLIVYLQIDPSTEGLQHTDLGDRTPVNTSGRLSSFPPLKPRDMIVDAENNRWQVESITPTRKLNAVVRQELGLHMIPRADIRHKVPVHFPDDPSPKREFTRPMTVTSGMTE